MKEILQRQFNLFDFNLEIESFTFALDASGGPGILFLASYTASLSAHCTSVLVSQVCANAGGIDTQIRRHVNVTQIPTQIRRNLAKLCPRVRYPGAFYEFRVK